MAYTATKYLSPKAYAFPNGFDQTAKTTIVRGVLLENDTSTEYSVGGIGSSSFEVTAFSNVGLVTFSALVGLPLINGQRVVVYNTASNTNDGTYIVSNIAMSSATAGTFTAVPIPGKTLAGSSQTTQTAEGVGQLNFAARAQINQTFTVSGVAASGGITTVTYTTLVGPQLFPGQSVTLPLSSGTAVYSPIAVYPTTSTGGSFTVSDPSAAATTGSGTGAFISGIEAVQSALNPIQVRIMSSDLGYVYLYDQTNLTARIFVQDGSAGHALQEVALGANVVFDGTLAFEAIFLRGEG